MEKLSLNGKWKIYFDKENEGVESVITNGYKDKDRIYDISVPSVWNTLNEKYNEYAGAVIYEKHFALEGDEIFDKIVIEFEASNYVTELWVNGKFIGKNEGGYLPFEFDITEFILPENTIHARVIDYHRYGYIFEGRDISTCATSKETWYCNYGGIYGDINIVFLRGAYVESAKINTFLSGEIIINLDVRSLSKEAYDVIIKIMDSVSCVFQKQIENLHGDFSSNVNLNIETPKLWTPKNPNLYYIGIDVVLNGKVVHYYGEHFGIKQVVVDNGVFYLNNEKIKLKGVLLQPNYPINMVASLDEAFDEREIRLIKNCGFNLIRCHLKPASKRYLELCDSIGLLVYQESPIAWMKYSNDLMPLYKKTLMKMAVHAYNHPSVIILGITNENWHDEIQGKKELVEYLSSIDSGKVIIDNSGQRGIFRSQFCEKKFQAMFGGATKNTEVQYTEDIHAYFPIPISDVVSNFIKTLGDLSSSKNYDNFIINNNELDEWYLDIEKIKKSKGGIFVSEFGASGLTNFNKVITSYPIEHLLSRDAHPYVRINKQFKSFYNYLEVLKDLGSYEQLIEKTQILQGQAFLAQIEAMRANDIFSAFVLTQFNDVSFEQYAGITDNFRNPKKSYDIVKSALKDIKIIAGNIKTRYYANAIMESEIIVVNDSEQIIENVVLAISIIGDEGDILFEEEKKFLLEKGVNVPYKISYKIVKNSKFKVNIYLKSNETVIDEKTFGVTVFQPVSGKKNSKKIFFTNKYFRNYENFYKVVNNSDEADIIVVTPIINDRKTVKDILLDASIKGKKIIILQQEQHDWDGNIYSIEDFFPTKISVENSEANFSISIRYFFSSELLNGLPQNEILDNSFANILSNRSLKIKTDRIYAGSIHNEHGHQTESLVDLTEIKIGKSCAILCQLHISKDFGIDPYSDKLFSNMINY